MKATVRLEGQEAAAADDDQDAEICMHTYNIFQNQESSFCDSSSLLLLLLLIVNNDITVDGGTGTDTCVSDPDPEENCEL